MKLSPKQQSILYKFPVDEFVNIYDIISVKDSGAFKNIAYLFQYKDGKYRRLTNKELIEKLKPR